MRRFSAGEPAYVALADSWIIINVGGGPTPDKPTVTLENPPRRDRTKCVPEPARRSLQALYFCTRVALKFDHDIARPLRAIRIEYRGLLLTGLVMASRSQNRSAGRARGYPGLVPWLASRSPLPAPLPQRFQQRSADIGLPLRPMKELRLPITAAD